MVVFSCIRTLQGQSSVGRSSLRLPSNNQYAKDTHAAAVSTSANVSPRLTKGSMLDRFNVFNKERQEKGKGEIREVFLSCLVLLVFE